MSRSTNTRRAFVIGLVQAGIDIHGLTNASYGGHYRHGLGGRSHEHGRKWPVLFAGLLLHDSAMMHTDAWFMEDQQTYYGKHWNGRDTACWSPNHVLYKDQNDYEHKNPSEWSAMEQESEQYRWSSVSPFWIGEVLCARLMGMMKIWNHPALFDYADRWMHGGYYPAYNLSWLDEAWNRYRYKGLSEIIIDNTGAEVTGSWTTATSPGGFYGNNYLHDGNSGKGAKTVRFRPNLPKDGDYVIFLRHPAENDIYDTSVPITIVYDGGTFRNSIHMGESHFNNRWLMQARFPFKAGTQGYLEIGTTGTTRQVNADAVKFMLIDTSGLTVTAGHNGTRPAILPSITIDHSPFHSTGRTLKIRVSFPKPRTGRIVVIDLRGREVQTIAELSKPMTAISAVWDGRNRYGDPVEPGMYLVMAETTDGAAIKSTAVFR